TELPASLFPYTPVFRSYSVGFLTRGWRKRCSFCVVPAKEGPVKKNVASFSDFVPAGQRNVMLLDDNLLAFPEASRFADRPERNRSEEHTSELQSLRHLV